MCPSESAEDRRASPYVRGQLSVLNQGVHVRVPECPAQTLAYRPCLNEIQQFAPCRVRRAAGEGAELSCGRPSIGILARKAPMDTDASERLAG